MVEPTHNPFEKYARQIGGVNIKNDNLQHLIIGFLRGGGSKGRGFPNVS